MKAFTVVVSKDPESNTYMASVPALVGCHTWGRTKAQAYRRAKDAISTYLDAARKVGIPVAREVGQKLAVLEE